MLSIYTALGKTTEEKAIPLICQVLRDFCKEGPIGDELSRCREQLKANILMGMENTSTRMHQLGQGELMLGRVVQSDELIQQYDAVTSEQIMALAREVLDFNKISISVVGQLSTPLYYKNLLS